MGFWSNAIETVADVAATSSAFMTGGPLAAIGAHEAVGVISDGLNPDTREIPELQIKSPFSEPGHTNAGAQAIADFENFQSRGGVKYNVLDQDKISAVNGGTRILGGIGIYNTPKAGSSIVGSNTFGTPVWSSDALKNNKDIGLGGTAIGSIGTLYGSVGAFKDESEAASFANIGQRAADETYLKQLDSFKSVDDAAAFTAAITNVTGADSDGASAHYAASKIYDNWNLLSPAQKSAAVAGMGVYGYKFSDGSSVNNKVVTPDVKGAGALNLKDVTELSSKGINVPPAVNKWKQLATIQDTFYKPDNSAGVVENMASMGMLGVGQEGKAVAITPQQLGQIGASSVPHYGLGAISVARGQGVPSGFIKTASIDDKDILIPSVNRSSSVVRNPVVATENASAVYSQWTDKATHTRNGAVGGSALAGNLHAMAEMNPYSLGAVMVQDAFSNQEVPKESLNDLTTSGRLMAVTFHRLKEGKVGGSEKAAEEINVEGDMSRGNFEKLRRNIRATYAKEGISSKEAAYQLANQAYAEGRIDDIQLVSAQKSLDMLYEDTGFVLAQKLMTGKSKGFQIAETRRG